jgi:hypothetical protein
MGLRLPFDLLHQITLDGGDSTESTLVGASGGSAASHAVMPVYRSGVLFVLDSYKLGSGTTEQNMIALTL